MEKNDKTTLYCPNYDSLVVEFDINRSNTSIIQDVIKSREKSTAKFIPKIGIIDSGIGYDVCQDLKQDFNPINDPNKLHFKIYREKLAGREDEWDTHGHGTHTFGIIHQIFPDAHYFIAKVLDESGRVYLDVIIDAIKWMRESDVDVINISLLFRDLAEDKYLQFVKELTQCKHANIPVFVAAGNHSPNQQVIQKYLQRRNATKPLVSKKWKDEGLVKIVGSYHIKDRQRSTFSIEDKEDCNTFAPGEKLISYLIKNPSFCFKKEPLLCKNGFAWKYQYAYCSGTSQATALATAFYAQQLYQGANRKKIIDDFPAVIPALEYDDHSSLSHPTVVQVWYQNLGLPLPTDEMKAMEYLLFARPENMGLQTLDNFQNVKMLQEEWKYFRGYLQPLKFTTPQLDKSEFCGGNSIDFNAQLLQARQIPINPISIIDYFKNNYQLYTGIYFLDILNGFYRNDNSQSLTELPPISIRCLAKYWRDVGGADYTRVPSALNQEAWLKKEMGGLYPFSIYLGEDIQDPAEKKLKRKQQFTIQLANLFLDQQINKQNYPNFEITGYLWSQIVSFFTKIKIQFKEEDLTSILPALNNLLNYVPPTPRMYSGIDYLSSKALNANISNIKYQPQQINPLKRGIECENNDERPTKKCTLCCQPLCENAEKIMKQNLDNIDIIKDYLGY